MKYSKLMAAAMSVCLFTGALGGCGKKTAESGTLSSPTPGKYVELELELPDEWNGWTAKQMFAKENSLHFLLVKEEENHMLLREWERSEDSFSDVTENWMHTLELPAQKWMPLNLITDGKDEKYLFAQYADENEDDYKGHLWRSGNDTALEITPEKWTILDEELGYYQFINGIAALDNDTLAVNCGNSVDLLYSGDGSLLESQPTEKYYGDTMLSDGENIYLFSMSNGGVTDIEKRPDGKTDHAELIPFSQSNAKVCVAKDGTLTSAGSDGIFQCKAGETDWKKLLSGSETDFSLSNCWCIDLATLEDGGIYALFQNDDNTVKLKQYVYDPDAVTEIRETLTLYAVTESFLLQNAAALYHREHPDVAIELQYGFTYNDMYSGKELDYNDVYQNLNTMLLSDNAPDILVMDHLNIKSFQEKELLTDINDVVSSLEEDGTLLKNITGSYVQENGKRYLVPLQFAFTYITGRDITAADMQSLENLAAFLSNRQENFLGAQTVEELVDKFYPYFCNDIIKDKELDKEVLKAKLEALKEIGDNCGIVAKHDDNTGRNGKCFNMWDLASSIKLGMDAADGFNNCMFPIAITEYINGDFTAFENSFTPMMQIGICAKSKYQDTAKDFLNFALSQEVQGTDYYSGFPVNISCLETLAKADRSDLKAETLIQTADGGEDVFTSSDYSQETAQKLLDLCKSLNKPKTEDEKIREVLIESLGDYLAGAETVDDAVSEIEAGLKMYLAE